MSAIQQTIDRLASHLARTWPKYEAAKAEFVRTTALLPVRTRQPDSSLNALDRSNAIADCQWYATDLQTTAAVLSALCLSLMGDDK